MGHLLIGAIPASEAVRGTPSPSSLACPSCLTNMAHVPGKGHYLCERCDQEWLCIRDGAEPTTDAKPERSTADDDA